MPLDPSHQTHRPIGNSLLLISIAMFFRTSFGLMISILILQPLMFSETPLVGLARLHMRLDPLNSPDKLSSDRESIPEVHMSVFRRVPAFNDVIRRIDRVKIISDNGDLLTDSFCHLNNGPNRSSSRGLFLSVNWAAGGRSPFRVMNPPTRISGTAISISSSISVNVTVTFWLSKSSNADRVLLPDLRTLRHGREVTGGHTCPPEALWLTF